MNIILNGIEYNFLIGYQKENKYRAAFNALAYDVFGLSFEDWFQAGYWNEKYIPYTLFDGEKAVANVSVNIMDFSVFDERKRYMQIGTNMTDENYRNKGLSRFLMETILEEWCHKCDLVYLYANSSVLNFYPKFDFRAVKEYVHVKSLHKNKTTAKAEKLNMDEPLSRHMLYQFAMESIAFGRLSMCKSADLVMFYCTSFLKDKVYYLRSLNVIAIAAFADNQLHLLDVFGKQEVELEEIIHSLADAQTAEVKLGFTPRDCRSYPVKEIAGDDVLFVQDGGTRLFDNHQLMFPLLSHA